MSRRPTRAVLGNLIVMVLLAVAGYALLRLHLGETVAGRPARAPLARRRAGLRTVCAGLHRSVVAWAPAR